MLTHRGAEEALAVAVPIVQPREIAGKAYSRYPGEGTEMKKTSFVPRRKKGRQRWKMSSGLC